MPSQTNTVHEITSDFGMFRAARRRRTLRARFKKYLIPEIAIFCKQKIMEYKIMLLKFILLEIGINSAKLYMLS